MDKEELIQRALIGNLNPAEKAEFERLVQSDEEFRASYAFEKDVKIAVQQEERSQLKSKLVNHETKPKFKFWHWAAAAMVLFSVSFGAWKFFQPETDLFTQNYEKFPNLEAPNTRAGEDLSAKETAYRAYDRKEYKKAYDLLAKLNEPTANFYAGICLIELGKFEQATTHLEALSFTDEYENHRLWYLSLLYLKQNENEKAKETLTYLAENQNVWREKAATLHQDIELP